MLNQAGQTTTNGMAWGGICPPQYNYCPCCGRAYNQFYQFPGYQQLGSNTAIPQGGAQQS